MIKTTNISAEQRLEKAVLAIMHRPEYIALSGVMMIGKRTVTDSPKVPTACTNGRDEAYGRQFVGTLTDAELRFLVLHEVYHKLYKHLTTWRWMYDRNAKVANMACDYVINIQLSDAHRDGWAKMPDGGLLDPKYRGWDSAKVFHDLMKDAQQRPQGGSGGQGGQGDGQPQPGEQGGGFDEHDWDGAKEMPTEEKEALARDIDEALRQGALVAGKLGTGGDRTFEDLLQPKIDWREVLREFIQNTCAGSDYSTWQKPSRRYIGAGYYMPSGISERIGEIVAAPDMSGSIGDVEIRAMLGEIKGIADIVHPEAIRLLYWDTEVTQDERYETHELDTMMQTTKPKGGGGTAPDCVPRYMTENNIEAQCAVVLTDGYVGNWGNWSCPVLWVVVDNPRANPPFGKVVHIEASDLR
jgi:predicted metal-dependent peptidase